MFQASYLSPLYTILSFFLTLLFLVFAFIIFYSSYKRQLKKREQRWKDVIATIISEAIFFENDADGNMQVALDKTLLQNKNFRQCSINEIIQAKKNLSGGPARNLKKLYSILEFDRDSLRKIQSKKWYIKAKGLQEVSIMEQEQYVKNIFRLTNHFNEAVRNEAQCALINFYGFKGFRFLNVIVHPISEWQQIQLLNYLSEAKPTDTRQLKKWLRSKNDSVITLALKLASFYNCYEVYREVLSCLHHCDQKVKLNALNYLKKITETGTSLEIIKCYSSSDETVQLNIISTLSEVGSEKEIPFLMKQLHHSNDKIKVAAARTLAVLHPLGIRFFQTWLFSDREPWKSIFDQIMNERAA